LEASAKGFGMRFGSSKNVFLILLLSLAISGYYFVSTSHIGGGKASGVSQIQTYEEQSGQNFSLHYWVEVSVNYVDYSNGYASLALWGHVEDSTYPNATSVTIIFDGDDSVLLKCDSSGGRTYDGYLQVDKWPLKGQGEMYPFDSYKLRFYISDQFYFIRNQTLELLYPNATFDKNILLRNIELLEPESQFYNAEFFVEVHRDSMMPFLQLLLPIVFCFFIIGGSVLIPRKELNSRLTLYLSLFVFFPIFLLAIQSFLPHRTSLSIIEILLVDALSTNALLTVISMIRLGDHWGKILDLTGTLVSMGLFALFYETVLTAQINVSTIAIFVIGEVGLAFGLIIELLQRKKS
jgi:hypothetical protein